MEQALASTAHNGLPHLTSRTGRCHHSAYIGFNVV